MMRLAAAGSLCVLGAALVIAPLTGGFTGLSRAVTPSVSPTGSIGTTGPDSTTTCADSSSQFGGDGPVGIARTATGLFALDYDAGRLLFFANPTSGTCPAGVEVTDAAKQPLTFYHPESVTLSADESLLFVADTEDTCTQGGSMYGCIDVFTGSNPQPGGGYATYDFSTRLLSENGVDLVYPRGLAYDQSTGLLFAGDDYNDRIDIFKYSNGGFSDYDSIGGCGCLYNVKALAYENKRLLVTNWDVEGQDPNDGTGGHPDHTGDANELLMFDFSNGFNPATTYTPSKIIPLNQPLDVAWNADGTFIVDSNSAFGVAGGDYARQYDATGSAVLATYAGITPPPPNDIGAPYGIASDGTSVFIADGYGRRVLSYPEPVETAPGPVPSASSPVPSASSSGPTPSSPVPTATTSAPVPVDTPITPASPVTSASANVSATSTSTAPSRLPAGYAGATRGAGVSPVKATGVSSTGATVFNVKQLKLKGAGSGLQIAKKSAKITIRFLGRRLTLHFVSARSAGIVTITLDGRRTTLNLYRNAAAAKDLQKVLTAATSGEHTVTIAVTGRPPHATSSTAILWLIGIS